MQSDQNRKARVVIAVVAGLLVFGWMVWLIAKDAGRVKLEIIVFPSDATLTIDGKKEKPGKIAVTKGEHTLKATRQYFGDVTKKINTNDLDLTQPVFVATDPNTRSAAEYLSAHPEEESLLERVRGSEFVESQDSLIRKYKFLSVLPHEAIDYSIRYEVSSDRSVADRSVVLIVTLHLVSSPGETGYQEEVGLYKKEALDYLKLNGADTTKTPVVFKNDAGEELP